jgi:ribosomal protein S18 acetylase RimI-like enzyme
MALRPEHVGTRVVVRRVIVGERGPSGGPAMTDVLGVLDALTAETLRVRRDDGQVVEVDRSLVVAAKPVPPQVLEPGRISAERLQLVCTAGWQAPVRELLGGWVLRAGGGFTGRANSVLPVGDPGMPLDDALERVDDFYARAGLPTQAQVIVGSAIMDELVARDWTPSRPEQAETLVQVAAPGRRTEPSRDEPAGVRLTEQPADEWLHRYGRAAGTDPGIARALLVSGDAVIFASLGDPATAIGRAVLTGRWVGLSAVEVDPALRRQGLGSAIVDALLRWGAERGARSAYLQALADNRAALALYARYGFRTHHRYRYLRPPTSRRRTTAFRSTRRDPTPRSL